MRVTRGSISVLCVLILLALACEEGEDGNRLPSDPREWVCESSRIEPALEDIEQFCESFAGALPLAPIDLRMPPPISRLDDKNIYDTEMRDFLRQRVYAEELGWVSDMTWRLTGSDAIEYLITLPSDTLDRVHDVQVTLYYQAIPPSYLQERFRDAGVGPAESDEIRRLYYITSHLDVDEALDGDGMQVLKDWKLFVTSAERELE